MSEVIVNSGVNLNQNLSLTFNAFTSDGLITLDSNLVKNGTRPYFQIGGINYYFGISSGYYFLYVLDKTQGNLSFTSINGTTISKSLTISQNTQYNIIALAPAFNINASSMGLEPFNQPRNNLN